MGFDWDDVGGPLDKIGEELDEVRAAIAAGDDGRHRRRARRPPVRRRQRGRHAGADAELALRRAAAKFRTRFAAVEALAASRGIDLGSAGLATLDALWDEVKSDERR